MDRSLEASKQPAWLGRGTLVWEIDCLMVIMWEMMDKDIWCPTLTSMYVHLHTPIYLCPLHTKSGGEGKKRRRKGKRRRMGSKNREKAHKGNSYTCVPVYTKWREEEREEREEEREERWGGWAGRIEKNRIRCKEPHHKISISHHEMLHKLWNYFIPNALFANVLQHTYMLSVFSLHKDLLFTDACLSYEVWPILQSQIAWRISQNSWNVWNIHSSTEHFRSTKCKQHA